MQSHIKEVLLKIEHEYDVKILYACESGSRAWGFPSKDSDYDVRFIYVHKQDWYLSIDQKRDVLEVPKHDPISIPVHELLDASGWELTKALKLFRKSNPPLLEWLNSCIVYHEAFSTVDKMKDIATEVFSPVSSVHHYLNMAKGNYRDYLKGSEVKIKKYFYILRPILASGWVEKYNTFPPMLFQTLVEDLIPADSLLKKEIMTLLERKMAGDELDFEPRIECIHQFVHEELERLDAFSKGLHVQVKDPTKKLDQLFRETLIEVWS